MNIVARTDEDILRNLKQWQEKEQEYVKIFGPGVLQNREFLKEKLRYYKSVYRSEKYAFGMPFRDSKALKILEGWIADMTDQLYPNFLERLFHDFGELFRLPLAFGKRSPAIMLYPNERTLLPKITNGHETGALQKTAPLISQLQTQNTMKNDAPGNENNMRSKNETERKNYVLADAAHEKIEMALAQGRNWVAYDSKAYFIDKENIDLFASKGQAISFAAISNSATEEYRVFHASSVADVFRNLPYQQVETILSQQKLSDMNEQNFDYLKNQLKYTGFGEDHQRELREKMQEGKESFSIGHKTKFGDDQVNAVLNFKKSDQADMYFFNRYFVDLFSAKQQESLAQSFRVGRENNVTLKEAYNLLSGRAVHKDLSNKEGEKYHAWLQLDFKETNEFGDFKMKQFHQNYGFDLKEALDKHPIKEMGHEQSARELMQSLERGNRQLVVFAANGKEQNVYVEAAPQFKSLNFYDNNLKRIQANTLLQGAAEKQEASKEKKQDQKKGINGEVGEGSAGRSRTRKKGHKIS